MISNHALREMFFFWSRGKRWMELLTEPLHKCLIKMVSIRYRVQNNHDVINLDDLQRDKISAEMETGLSYDSILKHGVI